MKKTYITTMPDDIGSFLKASRLFSELGINITRVSYNKAIDSHTLFIDAMGTEEQLKKADERLSEIGYINGDKSERGVVLIEFCLKDTPGSVTDVLSLIDEFDFNISYISSEENGTDYQYFKMGLFVDNSEKIKSFLKSAEKLCPVKVLDYNHTEKVFDNSIFYESFVSEIIRKAHLSEEEKNTLLINTNLAMQTLDERGLSPYKTFDSIGKFADLIHRYKGENFNPRITYHKVSDDTEIVLIEPPCGSNTAIIKHKEEALFIDSGYACYKNEMEKVIREILPSYDDMKKQVLITHADVDHAGLLSSFDEVLMSENSALCIESEYNGKDGFREQNKLHKPYVNICKTVTGYYPVDPEKIKVISKKRTETGLPLQSVGEFSFGDMDFEILEGKGGHLKGEIVLIDYKNHIVFSGDIYVNTHDFTAEQKEYNRYAPILMTSVDTDKDLSAEERNYLISRLGLGEWRIFGGHGGVKREILHFLPR